jgi:hypothetical protein
MQRYENNLNLLMTYHGRHAKITTAPWQNSSQLSDPTLEERSTSIEHVRADSTSVIADQKPNHYSNSNLKSLKFSPPVSYLCISVLVTGNHTHGAGYTLHATGMRALLKRLVARMEASIALERGSTGGHKIPEPRTFVPLCPSRRIPATGLRCRLYASAIDAASLNSCTTQLKTTTRLRKVMQHHACVCKPRLF